MLQVICRRFAKKIALNVPTHFSLRIDIVHIK